MPELSAADYGVPASLNLAEDKVLFPQQEAQSKNVELVRQIGGPVRGLALQGTYAYIGEGRYLVVLDVSDPTNPTPVGKSAPLPDLIQDVAIEGNYAYVTTHRVGLRVMDISNLTAPYEVGAYEAATGRIHIEGGLAYVVGGPMWILDISNPADPIEIGYYETIADYVDVYVVGDYAYVAGWSTVYVVDVSNPTAPLEGSSYDLKVLGSKSIFVAGEYAYLAYGGTYKPGYSWGGLVVIDVVDPTAPARVGEYGWEWGPHASDVFVVGGYAYLAVDNSGLHVLDVSDPENLTRVAHAPVGGRGVLVSQNHAYTVGTAGLWVTDISDPAAPVVMGSYNTLPSASDVFVAGDYVHVVSDSVQLVNVSNLAAPRVTGSYYGSAEDVMVAGGYAYIGWGRDVVMIGQVYGGLGVVDVSDPTAPAEVGAYDTGYYTWGVFVAEDYAYLAEKNHQLLPDQQSGLRVMDISDPTDPVEVGRYDMVGDPRASAVFVVGDYAYIAAEDLYVADISDPTAPIEAGVYETPGVAVEVYVSDNIAYVADSDGGLRVIDVSNPAELVEVGFFDPSGYAKDVYAADNYAYVAGGGAGLRVIDVLDPTAPIEVGFYDTPGYAQGVFVAGGYVYVADGNDGLVILQFTGGPACSIDADGRVGMEDMLTIVRHWRERNTSLTDIRQFDLDGDGIVTVRDVLLVGRQLGQRCP